ncbi:hypothetical protein EMIT0210MI2_250021 [Priestia megaterium]
MTIFVLAFVPVPVLVAKEAKLVVALKLENTRLVSVAPPTTKVGTGVPGSKILNKSVIILCIPPYCNKLNINYKFTFDLLYVNFK